MVNKKKFLKCRVCGKEFEPCAYCESHSDVFRWRNFACSKECAKEYFAAAIAYRKSSHVAASDVQDVSHKVNIFENETAETKPAARKRKTKQLDIIEKTDETV